MSEFIHGGSEETNNGIIPRTRLCGSESEVKPKSCHSPVFIAASKSAGIHQNIINFISSKVLNLSINSDRRIIIILEDRRSAPKTLKIKISLMRYILSFESCM